MFSSISCHYIPLRLPILLPVLLPAILLTGCATGPGPQPALEPPLSEIPLHTWREVELEITDASEIARRRAAEYAREQLRHWTALVWQHTERDFVPWYADYWTQQWLFLRLAWHQIQDGESNAREQMQVYLLEQFRDRVLLPVSQLTDPHQIAAQAASAYIVSLKQTTAPLQDRHRIPPLAWRHRLEAIPLVELPGPPAMRASLYQILQPGNPGGIPAYAALLDLSHSAEETLGARNSETQLKRVTERAVAGLEERMALRGGGAAAAAIAGGGIGILVSAGISAWGIAEHERLKPALVAELRDDLRPVLAQIARQSIEDRRHGSLTPVLHMHTRLEEYLWRPLPRPYPLAPPTDPAHSHPERETVLDILF